MTDTSAAYCGHCGKALILMEDPRPPEYPAFDVQTGEPRPGTTHLLRCPDYDIKDGILRMNHDAYVVRES